MGYAEVKIDLALWSIVHFTISLFFWRGQIPEERGKFIFIKYFSIYTKRNNKAINIPQTQKHKGYLETLTFLKCKSTKVRTNNFLNTKHKLKSISWLKKSEKIWFSVSVIQDVHPKFQTSNIASNMF